MEDNTDTNFLALTQVGMTVDERTAVSTMQKHSSPSADFTMELNEEERLLQEYTGSKSGDHLRMGPFIPRAEL